MVETATRNGFGLHARLLARRLRELTEARELNGILRTPDQVDWVEMSLSERQRDVMLRRGLVRRRHGEP